MKVRDTRDGSKTLHRPDLEVFYHSVHGAWSETRHVFGEMGLHEAFQRVPNGPLRVLEVGLGTGLNVLDVWLRAQEQQREVVMHSLEPHPLSWSEVEVLGYDALTSVPQEVWRAVHERGEWADDFLQFKRISNGLFESSLEEQHYDVVLFDAFAPAAQPELWTPQAMDRMRLALKPGGQLVTYCAKGDVRRAMEEAGFSVERVPGPPGKREMLRATRVDRPTGRLNVRVYMMVTRQEPSTGKLQVLVSYERLPMGGVMKFPGGGLEWGEGTTACLRREALEELGQPVEVERLVHVSQRAHISSFDPNHQVIAVHYEARLEGPVEFEDDGVLEDVFGKRVPMMHQRLGWRDVHSLGAREFQFASDREAWDAWRSQASGLS
ncbi:MAG: tRNA (5-methylaminomethyl-2-thiouridine)(34)-methyltransferase MnmD [Flavobacteriales bacterium]|nr:tRNA (5-methylaminomethyl-2-thiouridine)(34)-methyltransferase MnmD [Flavobacteriales bacterium]